MSSSRWTAADLPNLSGRTAVVTGASSGIGLVTARELARAGARVILAVRDTAKGGRAAATMPGRTEVRPLDVASLASIREFAHGWDGGLDILVNNAGVMLVPEGRTPDGFETHMATNYLGAFALTNLLLPHITGRIITISSQLHKRGHIHLDDLNGDHRGYNALQAHRDSKIANILFTAELQRRLTEAHSHVQAMTAHPGIARTSLNDHVGGLGGWLSAHATAIFNDADRGAYSTLYAVTQDISGGSYVGPDGLGHLRGYPEVHRPGRAARDNPDLARQLWKVSARLTGTSFP